mmetsp:Transcript_153161/g.267618  ORF Transcript_153161/g.267618 Transcript_153161/m.267618 type:complete len:692 (-) Transcript_153161:327-2402(-)
MWRQPLLLFPFMIWLVLGGEDDLPDFAFDDPVDPFDAKDCNSCKMAGQSWCPIRRQCGPFEVVGACPDDETAYAKDHPMAIKLRKQKEEAERQLNGPVQLLTGSNFAQVVLDENKHVMVMFHAPWCEHCKTFTPEYNKLASIYKDEPEIVFGKIDGTVYDKIQKKYGVDSYPTLLWFPKDQKYGLVCEEERTKQKLLDYVNKKTGAQRAISGRLLPHVGRMKELDQLVMALEDDKEVDLAALAIVIEDRVGAIYVDRPESAYIKIYSSIIRGMQTKNYLEDEKDRLESRLLDDDVDAAMAKHMQTMLNILPAFGSLQKLNVKALRAIAKQHGVDLSDAVEKADIRKAVERAVAMGADRMAKVTDTEDRCATLVADEMLAAEKKARRKAEMKRKDEVRREQKLRMNEVEKNSAVMKLTDKTYFDTVSNINKDVFVEIYAPWCEACRNFFHTWEEVAMDLQTKEDVIIAKLDAEENQKTKHDLGVTDFPTFMWYPKDFKAGVKHPAPLFVEGKEISKVALVEFVLNGGITTRELEPPKLSVDSSVIAVGTTTFNAVVLDPTKTVLVKFFAPRCAHCIAMAPAYDELAFSVLDIPHVAVAELDATAYPSVATKYSVKSYPTILLFLQDTNLVQKYLGAYTADAMRKYLLDGGYKSVEMMDGEAEDEEPVVSELSGDVQDSGDFTGTDDDLFDEL